MINCGKYILTFKYEFYGPCSRQLQQNYHIPIINYFVLIVDYQNIQELLVLSIVGHK